MQKTLPSRKHFDKNLAIVCSKVKALQMDLGQWIVSNGLALMFFIYSENFKNKLDVQEHEEGNQTCKLWYIRRMKYYAAINSSALAYLMTKQNPVRYNIKWNGR